MIDQPLHSILRRVWAIIHEQKALFYKISKIKNIVFDTEKVAQIVIGQMDRKDRIMNKI